MVIISEFYMARRKSFTKIFAYRRGRPHAQTVSTSLLPRLINQEKIILSYLIYLVKILNGKTLSFKMRPESFFFESRSKGPLLFFVCLQAAGICLLAADGARIG